MLLKRKRDLIAAVAAHWKEQYWHENTGWQHETPTSPKEAVYHALRALPVTATEDDVARIIGNRTWTENKCTECGQNVDSTVQVGQPPDYDSSTAWLCATCVQAAMELLAHAHQP